MARTRVTREMVYEAAEALATEGESPTLEGIRKRVGGSYSTLGPALRAWRERKAEKEAAKAEGADVPEALRRQWAETCMRVWGSAQARAGKLLEAEREALRVEREEMKATQAEIAASADRLAGRVEELEAGNARLHEELEAARRAGAQARAEADTQRELAAELRKQLDRTREGLWEGLADRVAALEQGRTGEAPD